jgi:histidine triad (HIT) family protein
MASIFTKIVQGEIPSYKVAEDDKFYAFLDINPLSKGHTLVIPKAEVDYVFDLEDELLSGLHIFAKKVAKAIENSIECKRIGVVVYGLDVPHAHVHLIPLIEGNEINFTREKLKLSQEEFMEIAQSINQHFLTK